MKGIAALWLGLALSACASAPATDPTSSEPAPDLPAENRELSMAPAEVAFREELEQARDRGLPILIQGKSYSGGRFAVDFYNASNRAFKAIAFSLQPFDSSSKAAGQVRTVRFRGPVRPSLSRATDLHAGLQSDVWPTSGIDCVEIRGLEITWMDDRVERYSFDDVTRMYREGVDKWCRFGA